MICRVVSERGGLAGRGKGKAHAPCVTNEPLDRTTVHSLILSLSSDDGAEVCVTYSLYPVSAAGVVERVVEPHACVVANGVAKCVTSSRRSKDAVSQAGLVGYHSVGDRLDVM